MLSFYDNYVSLCAKSNKSLSAVAEAIGLSRTSPNGWKKGKQPSDVTLAKLANYFGITVAELLGEEKEKTATNGDDLSAEELDFIRLYSEADEQKKAAIRILLGM